VQDIKDETHNGGGKLTTENHTFITTVGKEHEEGKENIDNDSFA
jgi:hypothetical protein